ncbi:MAG TPA: baseplate J/gp47 family protein [Kofleriaceae bacterium]
MSCVCDHPELFPPLDIGAGLPSLPRQIGGFPQFRAAMLAAIGDRTRYPALAAWRARSGDDLGLLLVDAWAYICDVLAFYDQVLANEGFLGTAQLPVSLRRQVALIGYRPRPAIAASARLAVLLDGRRPIAVPAGTAFRSGAFGAEPPQVFETTADAAVHPDLDQWPVIPPRPATLSGTLAALLVDPATVKIREGGILVVELGGATTERYVRIATRIEPTTTEDGGRVTRIALDHPLVLPAAKPLEQARLLTPTRRTGLWRQPLGAGDPPVIGSAWVRPSIIAAAPLAFAAAESAMIDGPSAAAAAVSEALVSSSISLSAASSLLRPGGTSFLLPAVDRQITDGTGAVVEAAGERRWVQIESHDEPRVTVAPPQKLTVAGAEVDIPAVKAPTTRVTVSPVLPTSGPFHTAGQITLHLDLLACGRLVVSAAPVLAAGDPIRLEAVRPRTVAPTGSRHFLLAGADQRGADLTAILDVAGRRLVPAPPPDFAPPLELPVTVYGNVVEVSRGETVPVEVLGSGDATQVHQTFPLQHSPLTYVPSATTADEWGATSTLTVWVDGLLWHEVASFFHAGPDDRVFLVRQTDDGRSLVTFGDGIRGARLPSGGNNVVASYRHGAGAAAPPAGSIKQLARPLPGIRAVVNPVAAAGGTDAEGPDEIRARAPRSALLLGRAVSLVDFQAAALAVGGVRTASAEWRWGGPTGGPAVHVFYAGGPGLGATIAARLRALSDPSTPIVVEAAAAAPAALAIDLETDPERRTAAVVDAVRHRLLDPGGLLTADQLGIGSTLFRSVLLREVMTVTGVLGVRALRWNDLAFADFGVRPGAGRYFDLETAGLTVTGSPRHG